MIILIAESKTMLATEASISAEFYKDHRPLFDSVADEIMHGLKELSVLDLAEETKLSRTLALKMQKYIYEFAYKNTGNRAIEAYTGVVFKALDYVNLSEDAQLRCNRNVRIISSLYGLLKPEDIVKTYRLDFTTKLEEKPVDGRSLNIFWRKDVTMALVKYIQEVAETEILVLLPGDASNCIDWKLVKRFAKVWKVDFREIQENGNYKTPTANKLKTLRGTLLRQILEEDVHKVTELFKIESSNYFCEGTPVYSDHVSFLC